MNKVLTVAWNEYLIAVTSKAFLVGVIMMPIFMGGAILVQYLTKDQVDLSPRKIAIVDRSGKLFESIRQSAEQYNQYGIFTGEGDQKKQTQAPILVEEFKPSANAEPADREDVVLTKRVKDGDLFAFAIIEQNILDSNSNDSVHYHTGTPSYMTLPTWLSSTIDAAVSKSRSESLQLSQDVVSAIRKPVPFKRFGLTEQSIDGKVKDAEEDNRAITFGVPFVGLMLMFMMIMSIAPTMLNNVLEEKMQKISEFLISSLTPFQLMLGKLLGGVCVGLTLSAIYLGAAYAMAYKFGVTDKVPLMIYVWFVFYLLIALIIFGSIFSAIGAACSEIRDAQSLMTPVILLVIIPMMCTGPILNSPSSFFARAVSLFPPATPMIMFMRIAMPPGPAPWEIALGTVFAVLFAITCVWAAGKIFRIGILSQGQAPTIFKLIGWLFAK
jgi:ABC-2 type transport system permease protein